MDTIFALASAPGKAGVAIIRVSGDRAHDAAFALTGKKQSQRMAHLSVLRDADGQPIDKGLILLFGKGASFTGEPVAEFQIHGSRASVAAVLARISQIDGLRLAEPGEFTRRALENGAMDLTEVEGLADLIEAETEAQRKQAFQVLSGHLAQVVASWRAQLIHAMSLIEVTIDFADEEVPVDVTPEVLSTISMLQQSVRQELSGISAAERIRDGFEVAIVGPPNIGKSTLLNRLARRDAALVSDVAGTTRDIVEVRMDIGGLLVTFLDTAGLRETGDAVETLGIERARDRAKAADLRIILTDGAGPLIPPLSQDDLVLRGKADQSDGDEGISGLTGAGVPELLAHIEKVFADRASSAGPVTRERHRRALSRAIEAMESALVRLKSSSEQTDLVAEDLRQAVHALDSMTGRIDVEDVLGEIFSAFCLGK
ncbi:MAG: tRNA uridine-5-carboxymethylaminomethyl(34) synthesis GTPase MnmE [Pseudomonadota bacterium]